MKWNGQLGGLLAAAAVFGAACQASAVQAQGAAEKVFRYSFPIAETGFDPVQISDLYSRVLVANIFDSLYEYDYLARPLKIRPLLATAMPEISNDYKTWTISLRKGVLFNDDAAFKGKKRELTADDVVYSYKRHYDPKNKSQNVYLLENDKLLGLSELKAAADKGGSKFDYEKVVEGVRALDRYTVQFNLAAPSPRFLFRMSDAGAFGIVAREVVEAYGDKIMEHPVGTGPFKLDQWKRSSKISFVKNPNFRDERYEAEPPADDARSQAIYAQMKGKRMPFVDRVEVSIVEEAQPRWLSFLGNEFDLMERLPNTFSYQVIPNNQLAPNLVKKGITMDRVPALDVAFTYFGMENPVVGGYTPEKVALRRAIALAYNSDEEVRLSRKNQAVLSQSSITPMTFGYDPQFKSEMSEFSRPKAMALLDMYGYLDKDGDGWRDMPDGSPLVLEYATSPDAASRELNELWKKNMDAVKIKIVFKVAKWPENLKASRNGKLMMWGLGWSATDPDGETFLQMANGPAKGGANHSRFDLPEFNRLFQVQKALPDGPERFKAMQEAAKLMVAYMPYKTNAHRLNTDLAQPWLVGYRRHPTSRGTWKFVDIDLSKLPSK
ncbi:MAG: bicyclomycin resistance protein [Rhodoferax sp.]|nr:bicyclomycin resistance protein [Rhodoferax sp.]